MIVRTPLKLDQPIFGLSELHFPTLKFVFRVVHHTHLLVLLSY